MAKTGPAAIERFNSVRVETDRRRVTVVDAVLVVLIMTYSSVAGMRSTATSERPRVARHLVDVT